MTNENSITIVQNGLTVKMIIIIIVNVGGRKMKKIIVLCSLLIMVLNLVTVKDAHAYSYGDPNEEKLAEVYKEILLKLNQTPPDFTSAQAVYKTVQEEVDMHMGPEPSKVIEKNFADEDKELLIKNLEKLLVLNIARRLEGIESNFAEFDTSKKLLAKGFATYQAISPKIEADDPELDKRLKAEFDAALKSLGNPGLFGVGQEESNLEAYQASKKMILETLQKKLDITSLEVGHFSESETEVVTNSGKKDWTDLSNLRNWVPLVLIVGVLAGIIIYTIKKRNRG
jgi:hypothetical protein